MICQIERVRKMPNTRLRRDREVARWEISKFCLIRTLSDQVDRLPGGGVGLATIKQWARGDGEIVEIPQTTSQTCFPDLKCAFSLTSTMFCEQYQRVPGQKLPLQMFQCIIQTHPSSNFCSGNLFDDYFVNYNSVTSLPLLNSCVSRLFTGKCG